MASISRPKASNHRRACTPSARKFPRKLRHPERRKLDAARLRSALLEVVDELAHVIDALACVPHLRRMARIVDEVLGSDNKQDRELVQAASEAADFDQADQAMVAAARVRLMRLQARADAARQVEP